MKIRLKTAVAEVELDRDDVDAEWLYADAMSLLAELDFSVADAAKKQRDHAKRQCPSSPTTTT